MIKRVKLDEFTLKYINKQPHLFYEAKQMYPIIHKLKKPERMAIIETGEAIARFALRNHEIQLDLTHKNLTKHMELIIDELRVWEQLIDIINVEKDKIPDNVRFGVLNRHADNGEFFVGQLEKLPLMRPHISSIHNRGSVLVFAREVIPYLNLESTHDLYSTYSNYLFVGKL